MLIASVVTAGLAAVGCGSRSPVVESSRRPETVASTTAPAAPAAPTRTNRVAPPVLAIDVSIPGLLPGYRIPKRSTCDGADVSLPLKWSHVPRGTAELAMFVVALQPVNKKLVFDWAVAGLNPTSGGFSAGTLPPGAVVGRNSFGKVGYSICPPKGSGEEHYVVRVVALPRSLAAKPGFDAEALYQEAERSAKFVGLAGGVYTPE